MADSIYSQYIAKFGCPPKKPTQLMYFSKKIGSPINWKAATRVMKRSAQIPKSPIIVVKKLKPSLKCSISKSSTNSDKTKKVQIPIYIKSGLQSQEKKEEVQSYKHTFIEEYEQYFNDNHPDKYYYTIRENVIYHWYRVNLLNCIKRQNDHSSLWILPIAILNLISIYVPPFKHELFLFDIIKISPNRIIFTFCNQFRADYYIKAKYTVYQSRDLYCMKLFAPKAFKYAKEINNWHKFINIPFQSLQFRVLLDIFITGQQIFDISSTDSQFMDTLQPKFELNLSTTQNAFITDKSKNFFVKCLTQSRSIEQNVSVYGLKLRSTNFNDYMLGLFCYCIQWRIYNKLPINIEDLDFSDNHITDLSFKLFCDFLPFMNNLHHISFEKNQLTDKSLNYLTNALNKMIVKEKNNKCLYSLNKIDLSNNLFSVKSIQKVYDFLEQHKSETLFVSNISAYLENFSVGCDLEGPCVEFPYNQIRTQIQRRLYVYNAKMKMYNIF